MTLNTHIYITDKVDHREVFNKVNDLLNIPVTRIEIEGPDTYENGSYEISNRLGQGFDAWVMSWSREDGTPFFDEHDEDDLEKPEEKRRALLAPYFVKFSLDTGYGYSGPHGETCSVLHAKVIVDLFQWLQEKGVGMLWQNEYTGAINEGVDGIEDFIGTGDEANAWFTKVVLPAIPGMLSKEA